MAKSAHLDTFTRDNLPPIGEWPELDFEHLGYPEYLNCAAELITNAIAMVGAEKVALIGPEGSFSYGEIEKAVNKLSNFLLAEGVKPGNRVLLRGPNNAHIVLLWLAVVRIGAVVVTTIHLQRAGELEKIVDIGQVQYALVDHRYLEEWEQVHHFGGRTWVYGSKDIDDVFQQCTALSDRHSPCNTAADDVCMLAFTSGSTGVPKATMHFHRDVLAIADTFSNEVLKPTSDDVFAGSPPIAFTFGLGGLVIFPFRVGATSVMLESAAPPVLMEKIAEFNISVLFTAPTAYRAMLNSPGEKNFSTLRRCVSAGEHLPKATWQQWFDETGIKIIDGIGATELLHIFISAADDEIIPGMTGKPVPGYRAKVVDENFDEVARGEFGRLAVQGPTGCRYLADSRQRTYVQFGWNVTGDIYVQHENGYFQYQSRGDDMIISAGYNIAAPEVENALLTHLAVAEAAVVGLPDEDRGMVVTAYVVLRSNHQPSDELRKDLQEHVKRVIAPFKYPRVIHFLDSLPKTTTGKLQRFRLKE
jgi:2-aminobenzoate-CoA ligase